MTVVIIGSLFAAFFFVRTDNSNILHNEYTGVSHSSQRRNMIRSLSVDTTNAAVDKDLFFEYQHSTYDFTLYRNPHGKIHALVTLDPMLHDRPNINRVECLDFVSKSILHCSNLNTIDQSNQEVDDNHRFDFMLDIYMYPIDSDPTSPYHTYPKILYTRPDKKIYTIVETKCSSSAGTTPPEDNISGGELGVVGEDVVQEDLTVDTHVTQNQCVYFVKLCEFEENTVPASGSTVVVVNIFLCIGIALIIFGLLLLLVSYRRKYLYRQKLLDIMHAEGTIKYVSTSSTSPSSNQYYSDHGHNKKKKTQQDDSMSDHTEMMDFDDDEQDGMDGIHKNELREVDLSR